MHRHLLLRSLVPLLVLAQLLGLSAGTGHTAADVSALDAAPTYMLTVTMDGDGAAEVAPGSGPYAAGTTVTLTARPAAGALFMGWTVDGTDHGWANPFAVIMAADHAIVATFAARPAFPDVSPGSAGDEAIGQLAARGIVHGYQDGRFGPQDAILRAQMAALICRTLGWEAEDHGTPFSDQEGVDADLWRNVGTLAAHGVARGYADGSYHPTEAVIQAQTVSFIARAMVARGYWQAQPDNPALYPEVPTDSGHRVDLATFVHYADALVETTGGSWPTWNAPATRRWFAQTLWQALDSYGRVNHDGTGNTLPGPSATPQPSPTPAPSSRPSASPSPVPSPSPLPSPSPSGSGFVGRNGTQFTLNGQPFRFVGFNLFDAAATDRYKCAWWDRYTDQELDQALGTMREQAGASVLRVWAFQSYTASGTDWSGLDKVIALARKHDMKIIPVLENGPVDCTNYGSAKWQNGDTFYGNAYRRDYLYGYPLSLPDYIDRIVGHYKDDPTIMAWTIMNEADTGDKDGLYTFASVLSAQIKALDPNHLVTLGTQSNGVSGSSGADFIRLYSLSTLDFAEGHDYAFWASDTDPLPGSADGKTLPDPRSPGCLTTDYIPNNAKIACSFAQAQQILGKPYLVGEAGVRGGSDPTARQRRADLLDAKMNAFFANGGGGYLVWQWNRILDTEQYDILIDTNDPFLPKMKHYADSFAAQAAPATATGPATPLPGDDDRAPIDALVATERRAAGRRERSQRQ
jgi:mannan endo-1,4-beta-mannosidase